MKVVFIILVSIFITQVSTGQNKKSIDTLVANIGNQFIGDSESKGLSIRVYKEGKTSF